MRHSFRFISDIGHGWLEVPVDLLWELDMVDAISTCSYLSPTWSKAYLEEDVDALRVTERLKALGHEVELNYLDLDGEWHGRWKFPRYSPESVREHAIY
jgi:hypothetical protein